MKYRCTFFFLIIGVRDETIRVPPTYACFLPQMPQNGSTMMDETSCWWKVLLPSTRASTVAHFKRECQLFLCAINLYFYL